MTELGLGCVQLGLPYGNAADSPLMPEQEALSILNLAAGSGITFFDTAAAYGESEQRIGLSKIVHRFNGVQISTKIPFAGAETWRCRSAYFSFLTEKIKNSCTRLGVPSLGLLQFHQHDVEFLESPDVRYCMRRLIAEGLCSAIGVSVYSPREADLCSELDHISTIQVPVNLLDRRFFTPELSKKYLLKRKVIVGRSILLQGVLTDAAPLPTVRKSGLLTDLRTLVRQALQGRPVFDVAISFAKWGQPDQLSIALIGADSLKSLEMNINTWQISDQPNGSKSSNYDLTEAIEFAQKNDLLNPSTWNQ